MTRRAPALLARQEVEQRVVKRNHLVMTLQSCPVTIAFQTHLEAVPSLCRCMGEKRRYIDPGLTNVH